MVVFHFRDKKPSSVLPGAPLPGPDRVIELPVIVSWAQFEAWKKEIGPRADLHREAGLVKIREEDKV
jgi:hypothetical protein